MQQVRINHLNASYQSFCLFVGFCCSDCCGLVFAFQLTSTQLAELYASFVKDYPIVSIEDPFDQDDWDAYTALTKGAQYQIVG